MKKLLFLSILSISGLFLNAQTTVTFKPNSSIGNDALLFMMDNGCIPYGWEKTPGDLNYGHEVEIGMTRWTYSANECDYGTARGLLKFTQLNTIPQNAIILSAELKLYGISTAMNTSFPNNPTLFLENSVIVKMVTSAWDEDLVTWNNQPTTTNQYSFIIPPSNLQYNWNYSNNSSNLISMIQNMVSNPNANNGFLFSLQNELQEYRSLRFASSDNPNSNLWPELIINYEIPCNAGFSTCLNDSDHPTTFTFQANTTLGEHKWTYGNNFLSDQPSFTYVFDQSNNNLLCHHLITEDSFSCEKCIKFCVGDIPSNEIMGKTETSSNIFKNIMPKEDIVLKENILIFPNPTKNNWTLSIISNLEEEIELTIVNIEGKQIYSSKENLHVGSNNFTIGTSSYKKGAYILQINGKTTDFSQKIIKE